MTELTSAEAQRQLGIADAARHQAVGSITRVQHLLSAWQGMVMAAIFSLAGLVPVATLIVLRLFAQPNWPWLNALAIACTFAFAVAPSLLSARRAKGTPWLPLVPLGFWPRCNTVVLAILLGTVAVLTSYPLGGFVALGIALLAIALSLSSQQPWGLHAAALVWSSLHWVVFGCVLLTIAVFSVLANTTDLTTLADAFVVGGVCTVALAVSAFVPSARSR